MSITTQNWDGVVAPSVSISGWSFASGLVTSAVNFQSSPNSLATNGSQGSGFFPATYTTLDGVGGDCTVFADFCQNGLTSQKWSLFGRSSTSPPNLTSSLFYELRVEWITVDTAWALSLYSVSSGTATTLSSVETATFSSTNWYRAYLSCIGPTITGSLQRNSDGFWMTSTGIWQSASATAISVNDSSVTGAGYWGVAARSTASGVCYTDNFELDGSPSLAYPHPLVVRVPFSPLFNW